VLTILPLSVAGAFVGLWLGGKTLSIYSMIGILLLMGITKKNSIILVDYANQIRESKSLNPRDAMLQAGPVRLRPILMTTAATMMAAVPSALGLGAGAETRGPMAIAVLGGLALSTTLSLLFVPAFYVVSDGLKRRLSRKQAGGDHPAPAPSTT
jgi:multidrug efflux pump subunit AcrB